MNGLKALLGNLKSMREFAEKQGFKEPISLKSLLTMPLEISSDAINLDAGDVKGWVAMSLFSNGQCSFSGHFHDSGTFLGDDYTVALSAQHPKVGVLVKTKKGSLEANENIGWNDPSFDLWIESNWATLIDGQTQFRGHLATKWGLELEDILQLLLPVGLLLGGAACLNDPNSTVQSYEDENKNKSVSCTFG